MTTMPFTGSYTPDDVQFLLKPMSLPDTPVHLKETLIQSGKKHYSQLLTHESLPPDDYLPLFYRAMTLNQDLMAEHLLLLAESIVATRPQGITLVSLARAGTPVGVLLKHVLKRQFHTEVKHYSISILRDVGIDANALRHILQNHAPESLVFIDGWTGKGVIARQLAASLEDFANTDGIVIPAELYVLTDLSGWAAVAASSEDYLIPSCILNATISGLVSRSVYEPATAGPADFHGCVYYDRFAEHDLSQYFIAAILARVDILNMGTHCGFSRPLPAGEGWGEGIQKSANRDRSQYRNRLEIVKGGKGDITGYQKSQYPLGSFANHQAAYDNQDADDPRPFQFMALLGKTLQFQIVCAKIVNLSVLIFIHCYHPGLC